MQLERLKLADKPSAALRQALADLELIERDERYAVEMSTWHIPASELNWLTDDERAAGKCHVCLAGAMLARSGAMLPSEAFTMRESEDPLFARLEAINEFRLGHIGNGLYLWHERDDKYFNDAQDVSVCGYNSAQPERFKADMQRVIKKLEEMGQ